MNDGARVGILGTGSYLPSNRVTNDDIAARVAGATPDWIVRKTLIRERRWAAAGEAASDLALQAAKRALAGSGVPADQIAYLVLATATGDSPLPTTACRIQEALGVHGAVCIELNEACAGFIYGLELARSLIVTHPGAYVLVVAADVYSRILDLADRRTAVLLGDGAAAAVVGQVPHPFGIVDIGLATRGDARSLIWVEAGGSRLPASVDTVRRGAHFLRMDGRAVRDFVLENVPRAVAGALARAGVGVPEVDHFVPHQANGVLVVELAERCDLSGARLHLTVEEYGNVGGASIPIALDQAARAGLLRDGSLVLLAGFGAGMSIGTCLMRWGSG